MRAPASIHVEVAYATPEQQWLIAVTVPAHATVADAIAASSIETLVPALVIDAGRLGVFSQARALDSPLRDGDRVEIYRALRVDPKEARRLRAARAKR